MNAMIFAAGLGTRLKPLTDTMPKAMVPVGGRPLVQILIERLKAVGVTEIVINVHHFAQQIVDFVGANSAFGIDIRFSDETDMLLETGGGLKKAARLFGNSEPILVHNVDILSNADLLTLYDKATCTTNGRLAATTLLVSKRKTQRYLLFDDSDRLVGWTNVATGEVRSPFAGLRVEDCRKFAFSGIQVFHPDLLPLMDGWQGRFSIIDFYLSICDRHPVLCHFDPDLCLLDVGKLDSIAQAEQFLS